ncbi:MAG: AMP-binding protein, partial [Clostridia bacterium]|nr:AMP-binding protein [Clostridia bacterium]
MRKDALHEKVEFINVRHLLEWSTKTYKDKCAYSYKKNAHKPEIEKVTFEQFGDDVHALASELIAMGCAGKHCALIGKFTYEWALTYYAALSIGAVLIPLDRDWLAEDLADTVEKAEAKFLFGDEDIAEKLQHIAGKVELTAEPVYLNADKEQRTLLSLKEAGKEKFANNPDAYYNTPIDPMRMALLVFTSGTTGKGKGVMLNQNAILSDMYNVIHYIDFSDKTVGVLPPHHTYGSTVMLIGHVMIGSEVYISSGIRYVAKELQEQKPGHMVLVPLYLETFYRRILANLKEKGKYDLVFKMIKVSNALRRAGIDQRKKFFGAIHAAFGGEIKTIITGGAPINPEMLQFYDSIGITILNGYGITECAPLIAVNRSRNVVMGSVGNPIDMVTVKIDEPNEDGEGEILVKGPNVMLGYYKDEVATADAFKDGYFRTGDYGKLGKGGVIYITGRKKNLIILSNGKNVYPEEIENELSATPGVLDIVVYEGQSRRGVTYNAIVAEVFPDKDFFEKNGITDIEAYLKPFVDEYNKKTVPYKKIGILKVREEDFPKNTLRKIQRFK